MAATENAQAPSVDKRWVCDADIIYQGEDCDDEQAHLGAACAGWGSFLGNAYPDLVFGSLVTKVREGTICTYPVEQPMNAKAFIFPGPQPLGLETREPYRLTYSTANLTDPWISDNLGWAITYLGDLDGDGDDELAISAPLQDVGGEVDVGTVYVLFMVDAHIFGSAYTSGNNQFDLEPPPNAPVNQSGFNVVRIRGKVEHGWFGHAIDGPGDVAFDSTPDLVVGAPHRGDITVVPNGDADPGTVYVIDGAAIAAKADELDDGTGVYGGVVGDLDWGTGSGQGAKSITPMHSAGDHDSARFGWSVSGMGNLDGDGRVEIAVGAPEAFFDCDAAGGSSPGTWKAEPSSGGTGFVEIIGFDSQQDPQLRYVIRGEQDLDRFGWAVSGLGAAPGQSGGNATASGTLPDLLVGAIGWDEPLGENERLDDVGKAYLIAGESLDSLPLGTVVQPPVAVEAFSLEGTQEGELLGESVAGGGLCASTSDSQLFAIGSRLYTNHTPPTCVSDDPDDCQWVDDSGYWLGRAQVFAFSGSSYDQIGDYTGEQLRNRLGYGTSLGWLPDMDGDCDSELLVGAPAWQPEVGRPPCNGSTACKRLGRAYVLFQNLQCQTTGCQ